MSPFLLVPLLAFGLALVLTPLTMALAQRWGAAWRPTRARDLHRGAIPRLGGLAMGVAFLVAAGVARTSGVPFGTHEALTFRGLLLGAAVALAFGVLDDRTELPSWPQFAMQAGVTGIAVGHTIWIERFNNPLGGGLVELPWWVLLPVTAFWFMGTMNTVNWLDGLDGLAAGVCAIAAAIFAAHMLQEGQANVALLALAFAGAAAGVLPFNFHPARTFIGSSGAFFLGYTLAALAIMAGAKVATLLLVLGIPILDVAWQIVSRLRRGRSPFHGDRGHLHHRLYDAGIGQRQVVLGYWAISLASGLLALLLPARIYKLYALLVLITLGALLLAALTRREKKSDLGEVR